MDISFCSCDMRFWLFTFYGVEFLQQLFHFVLAAVYLASMVSPAICAGLVLILCKLRVDGLVLVGQLQLVVGELELFVFGFLLVDFKFQ